jgi:hypothetical protein
MAALFVVRPASVHRKQMTTPLKCFSLSGILLPMRAGGSNQPVNMTATGL